MNSYTMWAPSLTVPLDPNRDHICGSLNALVTLVEYGDYQCSYCGAAYPIIEAVLDHLGDKICFAYRHFPITTLHPHAETAAEAAEIAGEAGQFWPMHHRLFSHQDRLDRPQLVEHAAAVGLDAVKFQQELGKPKYRDRVREDFMSGVRSGVNGTPSFFINGVRYDGSWDRDSMLAVLTRVMRDGADRIRRLFAQFVRDPGRLPAAPQARLPRDGVHRTVCDYIAGMTDRFLMRHSDDARA